MTTANQTKRILVVDDDSWLRQIISMSLIAEGYEVDTAEDGAQGWDSLTHLNASNARGYDLLVTDNNMPNLSGVGLIRKVHSSGLDLPIILASGNVPDNAEKLGLSAIISKPFRPCTLVRMVREVFEINTK